MTDRLEEIKKFVDEHGTEFLSRERFDWLTAELERIAILARAVMDMLEEDGPKAVPHLIDTDDNPGEFLRVAIEETLGPPANKETSP